MSPVSLMRQYLWLSMLLVASVDFIPTRSPQELPEHLPPVGVPRRDYRSAGGTPCASSVQPRAALQPFLGYLCGAIIC